MPELRVMPPKPGRQLPIRLDYDAGVVLPLDVEWFAGVLRQNLADGALFEAGQTLQLGGTTLRIERDGAELMFTEPDMEGMPMRFARGVSQALTLLRMQKDIAQSFSPGFTPDYAWVEQTAIVCNRLAGATGSIMERVEPEAQDQSGWFVGCPNPKHRHDRPSELTLTSVYELMCVLQRACGAYLALPPGTSLVRFPGEVDLEFNGKPRQLASGSFLDALIKAEQA